MVAPHISRTGCTRCLQSVVHLGAQFGKIHSYLAFESLISFITRKIWWERKEEWAIHSNSKDCNVWTKGSLCSPFSLLFEMYKKATGLSPVLSTNNLALTLSHARLRFGYVLRKYVYLGPVASILLNSKCVAPWYTFSKAVFQVSELNSRNCRWRSAFRNHIVGHWLAQ